MSANHYDVGDLADRVMRTFPDGSIEWADRPADDWQPVGEQPPAAAVKVMQQVIDGLKASGHLTSIDDPYKPVPASGRDEDPVSTAARRLVSFYNPHVIQQPADFWAALGNLVRVVKAVA